MADKQDTTKPKAGGNQADNLDLQAIAKIRELLNEFYPEVRKAILEYCLFITEKDLEA